MIQYLKHIKLKKIIEKSGLFDIKYYLFQYPDVRLIDFDPIMHYLKHGAKEGRNPSKSFNTKWYLNAYSDVRDSKMNPLVHYILFGKKEGRKTLAPAAVAKKVLTPKVKQVIKPSLPTALQKHSKKKNLNEISKSRYQDYSKLLDSNNTISAAIIVHLYYIEEYTYIYEKLQNIKEKYTLYITTTKELHSKVKTLHFPKEVEVKIFPFYNMGMDIYPFLQVLKNLQEDKIEIFCKLHTKRGNDVNGAIWRDNLLENTIGSHTVFSGIIHAFQNDQELSLVGPASFYKSTSFLLYDNKEIITEYLKEHQLSATILEESGFFAGSTFFGRVDDFINLSNDTISTKFSTSASSNADGRVEHSLERIFGLIPSILKKKTGIVYLGNEENEYYLEKFPNNRGFRTNISDTVKQLTNFHRDLRILQNFKLFDRKDYAKYFPHLQGHDINFLYHYLLIGQYSYTPPFQTLLEKFHYAQEGESYSPYVYLASKSTLKDIKTSDISEEFFYTQIKMAIAQANLIEWKIEKNKSRDKNLVSVVIPVYGQAQLTQNCLESLFQYSAGCDFEVIVVNNGQVESDAEVLKKWEENHKVKIIQNGENLNFALGCNLGFTRAIGEYVVFLNNDTTVTENWLNRLIEPLIKDKNISTAQPKLLYPDNTLQCMGILFSDKSDLGYPLYQGYAPDHKVLQNNRKLQAVTGACLAIRAEDFILVEGFDIRYVNGQEDVDLCLKLNKLKNTTSLYVANSLVYHYEGKTEGRGKFVAENRKEYLKRWRGAVISDDTLHYHNDGYRVVSYKHDNDYFKSLKIETYKPELQEENSFPEQTLPYQNRLFFQEGDKTYDAELPTVVLSSHSLSKEIFGGERSFLDMVDALSKCSINLIITLPNNKNLNYINLLRKKVTSIYIVNYHFWTKNGLKQQALLILENIFKEVKAKLVYVNTIVCREPLTAAKRLNIPTAVHVRELIDRDKDLLSIIGLQSAQEVISEIEYLSDFLVCNSDETMQIFKKKKRRVIYNKIEADVMVPSKENSERITFGIISSNIPKKGIYDFLEVAKRCKEIHNAYFILIGPINNHMRDIQQHIDNNKLENIHIHGYVQNTSEAISLCNVVMNLSHVAESFGRTIAEALAFSKPVIAYKWGAIPELVEHNSDGYLCEYKNIDEVVKYTQKICNNPTLLKTMPKLTHKDKFSSLTYDAKMKDFITDALHFTKKTQQGLNITVIIPIYNAYLEVINCIDSVLSSTSHLHIELLLINDASSDERMVPLLERYNQLQNVQVITNEKNLGYTPTINKAIKLARYSDVVLLNSDTITPFGWLEELHKTAYSNQKTGTVTAMSDNAGAFSFPIDGHPNPKPLVMSYSNYADIILRNTSRLKPVQVPTGSGFCFFIKGELIKTIGLFNDTLFPRGYGEENDFCMRALQSGYTNVIASSSFVFHIRTASFGAEKQQLVEAGTKELLLLYPSYNEEIREAFTSKEINELRAYAQEARNTLKNSIG